MKQKNWQFAEVWNNSFLRKEERPIEPRDRIWASELGKSDIDIFLKLKGEAPSNSPDDRAKRKFEAGDIWEWIVQLILMRAGVYKESQTPVRSKIEYMLEVSGKLDHVAGGKPDYEKSRAAIEAIDLPDVIKNKADAVMEHFEKNYPDGLEEKILEVKSAALISFDKVMRTGRPLKGHDLQLYHYTRTLNMVGTIVYVCKDDARIFEVNINPYDEELEKAYVEKITRLTDYYDRDVCPTPEPMIVFDENDCKFSLNFNVGYSSFLTKVYKLEHQEQYREIYSSVSERWNRVVTRILNGDKMTDNNLQAIQEMKSNGFDVDKIIFNSKQKTLC